MDRIFRCNEKCIKIIYIKHWRVPVKVGTVGRFTVWRIEQALIKKEKSLAYSHNIKSTETAILHTFGVFYFRHYDGQKAQMW